MKNHSAEVDVRVDESCADAVDSGEIGRWAARTLATVAPNETAALTVVVTDDATIRALNREYLGIDVPTDVLAFSQIEGAALPDPGPGAGRRYLGDVVVSFERAVVQADEYNEPVERELSRLVVHGTLHLLGYEDQHEADREKMWEVQERILSSDQSSVTSDQ
ncbi:MAG: rRNA maturation RNase YbeY [Anaerolineae bacterium]